jgi:hypothetical protein
MSMICLAAELICSYEESAGSAFCETNPVFGEGDIIVF